MSGGSYNYLYCKEVDELLNMEEEIQQMADRLAGLGYASDAARETEEFLLILRQFKNRMETIRERLSPVWRAIEWWDSNDEDENSVKEALKRYREEKR